jgi:hypothetical protein
MAEFITIPIRKLKLIGLLLMILIIAGLSFYAARVTIPDYMDGIKQERFTNGTQVGYQSALLSIAYTIATNGEVSYIVPTTNITLTLIQKK